MVPTTLPLQLCCAQITIAAAAAATTTTTITTTITSAAATTTGMDPPYGLSLLELRLQLLIRQDKGTRYIDAFACDYLLLLPIPVALED